MEERATKGRMAKNFMFAGGREGIDWINARKEQDQATVLNVSTAGTC